MGADPKDELFERLRGATPEEAAGLEVQLAKLLGQYAAKIVWLKLSEARPDVVNDAVYAALKEWRGFKGSSRFSTWFTAIVIHKCQDELRRRFLRRERELPLREAEGIVDFGTAARADKAVMLSQAIERLVEPDRTIAKMLIAGESYEAVGISVGLSEANVRQRWSRLTRKA